MSKPQDKKLDLCNFYFQSETKMEKNGLSEHVFHVFH